MSRRLSGFYLRFVVVVIVVGLGSIAYAPAWAETQMQSLGLRAVPADQTAEFTGQFPRQLGEYTFSRTWKERFTNGVLIYEWAEYARKDNALRIQVGVSPVLGAHDTALCHVARGEDPIWQDAVQLRTMDGQDTSFTASLYNDGVTQFLEANTQCTLAGCGEYSNLRSHFGLVYSLPHPGVLLDQAGRDKPLPILLRAETEDATLPTPKARELLLGELRGFIGAVSLTKLTHEYRGSGRP